MKYNNFLYLKSKRVNYTPDEVIDSSHVLLKGLYELQYIGYPEHSVVVKKIEIRNKPNINHSCSDYIYNVVNKFKDDVTCKHIKSLNMDNRFGILLYGDAGTGKSSIINNIISDDRLISFIIASKDPDELKLCWDFIMNVREGQDDRFVIVFDEFDEFNNCEALLKQIMDGQYSIDNCLFLMSTNYIDSIPDTIKNRPSRCKYVIKVEGIYDINTIKDIIKNAYSESEIDSKAKSMIGKTLDEIKNQAIDDVLKIEKYATNSNKIGFKKSTQI